MATTVEINDAMFCEPHLREVCSDCSYDGREENDSFFGLDPMDRDEIDSPAVTKNKDGIYQCKKHGSAGKHNITFIAHSAIYNTRHKPECKQCFNWKKQITRARTEAKKAGRN
ncbi:hypothetical protein CC1G_06274 [Coprinopsis cinerea okayama7|uniref:Uncharacterized protein n=1 Tax=Coprinopsis cinerea (strain Okayama-7 / 130 / ATCC MYA-4618 / FGSC 9003) TaxID=240176 RepID=A8NTB5_COPC7|nr:hypothetical protein CC1G_06274 [Coprinopsis cinerea okayama7\|eukprot:XP_001836189.1 hypothetical protein CC1G_06274 [Coprinopsis cinerea okayama7\